eukprot:COSAG02_NODE_6045_length_3846_cov_5.860155_1_plen_60_part_10
MNQVRASWSVLVVLHAGGAADQRMAGHFPALLAGLLLSVVTGTAVVTGGDIPSSFAHRRL